MAWDFETEPAFEAKLEWMREFMREEVFPLETLAPEFRSPEGRVVFDKITAPLKQQVKDQGLWAAHLPPELGGGGFGPNTTHSATRPWITQRSSRLSALMLQQESSQDCPTPFAIWAG